MACQLFQWLIAGEGPSTLQHGLVGDWLPVGLRCREAICEAVGVSYKLATPEPPPWSKFIPLAIAISGGVLPDRFDDSHRKLRTIWGASRRDTTPWRRLLAWRVGHRSDQISYGPHSFAAHW